MSLAEIISQDIRFHHLTIEDGLSQSGVQVIMQDQAGFMWFGTDDGLNRYDGYRFKIYRHAPNDPHSLSHNSIMDLHEDDQGFLWIATRSARLSCFDPLTEQFTTYHFLPEEELTESTSQIYCLFEDRAGRLWVGTTEMGLLQFDRETKIFTHYPYTLDTLADPNKYMVSGVYEDRQGRFWVALADLGLKWFDPENGQFHPLGYADDVGQGMRFSWGPSLFCEDQAGHLWVVGDLKSQSKVNRFSLVTQQVDCYDEHFARPGMPRLAGAKSIYEDRRGHIWALDAGGDGALYTYDPRLDHITCYQFNPTTPQGLSGPGPIAIYEDRSGGMWIGMRTSGISYFHPLQQQFGHMNAQSPLLPGFSGRTGQAVYEDRAGDLWLGTRGGGLNRLNGQANHVQNYRHQPDEPGSLSHNEVKVITQDQAGEIWVGTSRGFNQLTAEDDRFLHYTWEDGKTIIQLHLDQTEGIWFSTWNSFLRYLNTQTGEIKHYPLNPEQPAKVVDIHAFLEDESGRYWLGTSKGLYRFDPKQRFFEPFPIQHPTHTDKRVICITAIYQAEDGLLWLGLDHGLLCFDPQRKITHSYDQADGLTNEAIKAILPDRQGHLWISTLGGLYRFNPVTEDFRQYGISDGLQSNEFTRGFCKTRAGWLIFGDTVGFIAFDPTSLQDNKYVPPVVLTDFLLFNQPVSIGGENSPLKKNIEQTTAIHLTAEQYSFSFEFAALNYFAPHKNRYKYKLEGFDQDWNEVGSDRRYASYTNLPAGEYTFRVLGSNNHGVWNEAGVSLKITVEASLVDQLQAEKEAAEAANEAKSTFLSSMSHELRTPLNGILGYAQILKRRVQDPNTLNGLDIIERSGDHLLTLINDILDLAKVEAGKLDLQPSEINLALFVGQIIDIIRARAETKSLSLSYENLSTLPAGVMADEKRLRQVLLNLLGNAIKFTQQGGISLTVEMLAENKIGDGVQAQLRFSVKDSGVGMSSDQLEQIFQPFEQVGDREKQAEGTGLGLAISREIVEVMGGELRVESQLGQGSRFWFEVSLLVVEVAESTPVPAQIITGYEGPRRKVLVVDDEPYNRLVLVDLLEPLGFVVETAENGRVGLEKALDWHPDVILMDLVMPKLTGFEVAQQIRQETVLDDIVMIAVSASVLEADQERSRLAGFDSFVPKPIEAERLLTTLSEQLKLEWRYAEDSKPTDGKEAEPVVLPPQAELEALHELARRGNLIAIAAQVKQLVADKPEYGPFAERIGGLARAFEEQEIELVLENYLNSKQKS